MSGHSYNPSTEMLEEVKDYILSTEGKQPRREKKIKKLRTHDIIPRTRNKKVRAMQLAVKKEKERKRQDQQLISFKKTRRELDEAEQIKVERK